ncbi:Transmembrane protein, partial [Globisporangium splendens]
MDSGLPLLAPPSGDTLKFRKRNNDLDERDADGLFIVLTGTAARFVSSNATMDGDDDTITASSSSSSPTDTFGYQEHFGVIVSPTEATSVERVETTVVTTSELLECIWLPELVVRMLNIQPRLEHEFALILHNHRGGGGQSIEERRKNQEDILLRLLRAGVHVTVLANTRNTTHTIVLLLSAPLWLLAREDKLMAMERIIENHAEEDNTRGTHVSDDYEYHAETMTASDRIAAFASILTRPAADKPPGVGLRGIEHNLDPVVRDVFPLHDPSMTDFILSTWFKETHSAFTKRLFLLRIKDYFGLRIAFFTAFVRLYNAALVYPLNVGVVLWIFWRWIHYRSYVKALGIYGLCIAFIWAPSFLKRWKRYENSLLVEWNLLGTKEIAQPNPEFRDYVVETINVAGEGEPPDYVEVNTYDHRRRWPKYAIFGFFCTICLVLLFVFVGQVVPLHETHHSCTQYCDVTTFDREYYRCNAPLVGCFHTERGIVGTARWFYVLVQGIVLGLTLDIVFLAVFEAIALAFNRWESYQTEQEREKRSIEKIFLFNWVGYFYWFFLLAFVYVPNGDDVQYFVQTHADRNWVFSWNKNVRFSRYWIDGLISMDSAFVTPMIVTQALNLVTNTFVPYLLRRVLIRARDSYHVKKERLFQTALKNKRGSKGSGKHGAKGADYVHTSEVSLEASSSSCGDDLHLIDNTVLSDTTDRWIHVTEQQQMNRDEVRRLLAEREPIAANELESAVRDHQRCLNGFIG